MTRKESDRVDRNLERFDTSVLREIGDALQVALAVFDRDHRLLFANRKFHEVHHAEDAGLQPGDHFKDIIGRIQAILPEGERDQTLTEMSAQLARPDGEFREKATLEGRFFRYRMVALSDGNALFTLQNITAHKVHEIRLEEKSRQLSVILEEMAEGVIIIDRDRNLVLANEGLMEMYGFPPEINRAGTPAIEFARWRVAREAGLQGRALKEAARERIQKIFDDVTQTETAEFETLEDGRIVEVRRRQTPEGYLISTYVDISERLKAEQALKDSEVRFKAILEDQTEYISRLDADLHVTFANGAYKRAYLPDPENQDVVGLNILTLIADQEERERYRDSMLRLTPDNPILKSELWERVADGSLQWQAWTDRALFDETGTLTGFQSVGRDITEKKIAEDALAANLRERDAIVTGAIDAIVSIDSEGRIRDFNAAAEHMFGYARSEAKGQLVRDLIIPHEHRGAHDAGLARYLEDPSSRSIVGERIELEGLKKNGDRFPIELAVVDASGEDQILFVAYVRDLTKARELETTLERQRQAIAQSEKMSALGSLLASVAHELNNPLSVVIGQASLLSELAADDGTRDRGDRIKRAADRCANIIKTFLAMARQKPVTFEVFCPTRPVAESVELVEYSLKTSGIELTVDIADNLPMLNGDATQIGQILTNLLVNAQHALSDCPQPRAVCLTVRPSDTGEQVVFRVADNGRGIPPEHHERIFEPFFTTKDEGSGTGIGLAVAHNISVVHGGSLRLLDDQNGAVFELSLPVHDGAGSHAAGEAPVAPAKPANPIRILVVDDEAEVAKTVAETLDLSGYECQTAIGGDEALNLLEHDGFDIILSDLRMPDIAGPELYQLIGERLPEYRTRFGFFTGDTLSANASRFLSRESVPHIEKPFTRTALERLVLEVRRKAG